MEVGFGGAKKHLTIQNKERATYSASGHYSNQSYSVGEYDVNETLKTSQN